ncbi:MAG: TonB-dependent receptor plug domain-containing protein [Bacteroidales bacterium]|nr:TonB-dependent receptor plug domain-containing protein [Bacteroidales bacterium]
MIKQIYITSICLFLALSSFGQTLVLQDAETKNLVAGVAIFNKDHTKSALSNSEGEILLDVFSSKEMIYMQHPSYKKIKFTKESLKSDILYVEKNIIQIEEFVISAYRWEQNKSEIPNKITRLSQKDIIFNNPQTTADLLANSNEVFVQKSQLGGGSPMIRGFSTNTVLLVIDGVRMNNAIYREGNLQNVISLDANVIESSEIIFGPGSVTYGSDALGGVMDFHTLRAKLSTSEEMAFSGNAFARYSSANKEKTGHLDFNIASEKWASLTSISYSDFDDLRMGSKNNSEYKRLEYVKQVNGVDSVMANSNPNIQYESGYNQINLMQKVRFRPTEKLDLNYAFHYSKLSDVPRYDRLIQYKDETLKYGDWYYGPQIWMMHTLNASYLDSTRFFDRSNLTFAYQDYKESRHSRKYRSEDLSEREENVLAYSLNLDFDKNLKRDNQLFYGLEAVYNKVISTAHNKNILTDALSPESTRYPDGDNKYTTVAAYLSYKENFSEKFTMITGIRANYVNTYSTLIDTTFFNLPYNEISVSNSALNGSIGIVYKPVKTWQINLNLSSGFHAPNIDDMSKIFDSEPGNVVVPNKNLKPEYAYNIDLGISKSFKNIGSLSITGFYTFIENAFVRRDFEFNGQDSIIYEGEMSKTQAIVNADGANVYGLSAALKINVSTRIKLLSKINYTTGKDHEGEPLRHVAPLFGTTRLSFTNEKFTASVYANYNDKISYNNLAPSEQGKPYMYASDDNGNPFSPAWWTLNFMSSINYGENMIINLGIENIFDNRYRPYSSGIVAPGRNLIVGVRLKF